MDSLFKDEQPKLLYTTPEKILKNKKFMNCLFRLYQMGKLERFVIDEAHCVSKWGRGFRPDYFKLNVLREEFPDVPLLALTGTATEKVKQDIIQNL